MNGSINKNSEEQERWKNVQRKTSFSSPTLAVISMNSIFFWLLRQSVLLLLLSTGTRLYADCIIFSDFFFLESLLKTSAVESEQEKKGRKNNNCRTFPRTTVSRQHFRYIVSPEKVMEKGFFFGMGVDFVSLNRLV